MCSLADLLPQFLTSLRIGGFSARSVSAYKYTCQAFIAYLAAERGQRGISGFTRGNVNAWLSLRLDLSSNTIAANLLALRAFSRWLVATEHLACDPMRGIPLPRKARALPRFLDEADIAKLREATRSDIRGVKLRAVIDLLYATGLRVSELVALDLGDLNETDCTALVRMGKGSKDRIVFVGEACHAMRAWLKARLRWARPSEQAVFVSDRGRRCCKETIERLVRLHGRRVLGRKVTPHMFRHSLGKHMLDHGADLRTIQELLGHATLQTTQIYTHTSREHLREVYERTHPMGKKLGR